MTLQFDSLMNLSGVDDANGEKKTDEDGTVQFRRNFKCLLSS